MESDKKELRVDEFGQICRICLLSNIPLQSIPQELSNLFKNITNIEFKIDDHLPQNLCRVCVEQLEDIRVFIEKCKDSYSLLLLTLQRKPNVLFDDILDETSDSENDNEFSIHPIKSENYDTVTEQSSEIIQNNTKLSCAECGNKFSLKKYLLRHISWHCRALKYSCESCRLKCKSQEALQLHSNTHCVSKVFICYICSADFSTAALMHKHLRIKHKISSTKGVSNFPCNKCDRILTSLGSLTNHMRTHTGEKPFSCMYCNKAFAYLNSLTIHTRLHTGETPFTCEICKKSFRSSTTLKKHQLKIHYEFNISKDTCSTNEADKTKKKGAKEIECKVCHKKLYKHGLGAHMRVHLVVKKEFICRICNKQFQKNSRLERHMRIHTGERPYNCSYCDKAFTQDNDLKRHLARHTNDKKFQCQHCGKRYYSKSALRVHLYTHMEAKNTTKPPCTDCAPYFLTCGHGLGKSEKPHLCTVCGKSFTAKSSLIVHTRLHTGDSPFPCSSCDKKYVTSTALKKHVMRNHTGEKSHICMICQKSYYDSSSLKQHMDRVHAILDFKSEKEEMVN